MSKNTGKRHSEEQIIRILKGVENGRSVVGVCRQYDVARGTVYRWRSKYGGMERSELHQPRELEAENH